ncbi:MAG: formylglycine-generating enzyme family protein [Thermoguttaceae bacterium]|nr:formylglycine-generating enzyme family protein [Thermoguttaceae bacterium]
MKRYFALFLAVALLSIMGCEAPKAPEAPEEDSQEVTSEDIQNKIRDYQDKLQQTEELLIKRIAERDAAKTEFLQLIRGKGKTPKEIVEEFRKESSDVNSKSWFNQAKRAWQKWEMYERPVVVFTRQKERLDKSLEDLNLAFEKLKLNEENKAVYISGEDSNLDEIMAGAEINIDLDNVERNLSDVEKAEVSIKVVQSMMGAVEKTVSKIPGLKLLSIDELPALPDIAKLIAEPANAAQKSLFGRVKNDCNKIVNDAGRNAKTYLNNKQPEIACDIWLQAIDELCNVVNAWEEGQSVSVEYLEELETRRNETLLIMCKPFLQSLKTAVEKLENEAPDWETIMESLEGTIRIHPTLSVSELKKIDAQMKIIRLHLKYLVRRDDMDAKVIKQRLETILNDWKNGIGRFAGERMVINVNGVDFAFRWAPAGTFTMGSPESEEERDDDEAQHRVTLTKGFWIMETEVTQKQWIMIMGNNPSNFEGDDLPVENVSWNDCQEFCKRCARLGMSVQLPTETQWEYACRAGTTEPYAGNLNEMAWYSSNSGSKTHPVGTKKPNSWGLYDMHGNVWEWCLGWKAKYPKGKVTDPSDSSKGSFCVNRGGSWISAAKICRSAERDHLIPTYRYFSLGFRCVKKE